MTHGRAVRCRFLADNSENSGRGAVGGQPIGLWRGLRLRNARGRRARPARCAAVQTAGTAMLGAQMLFEILSLIGHTWNAEIVNYH